MTLVWPTRRQALEWVFIGLFVLGACLLLVPHGNAASVKVPPGQLWTCHVAEAEADMMSGPEMYSQQGRLFAVYRLDRNHDGAMDMLTIHDVRGQSVHRFPRYYVYDKDFDGKPESDAQRHNPKLNMVEIAGLVAEAEHARAVRIVKRAKALQFHGLRDTDTNEFLEGYEAACVDILAALSKGRA